MRTHTSEFKEEIKLFGRQIKGKIFYYPNYNIISESGDTILTETDIELISEQFDKSNATEIDSQLIYSIDIVKNGQLLQSLMKELDVELKYELNIGSVINAQFGLLVNDSYEYLDYGNYIVYSKEFNLDTETWNYVCYDMMLYSMIKYRPLSNVTYPITIRDFIGKIATKMGVGFANSNDTFTNYNQLINEDVFKNKGYTLRDILDKLSQITASNILINDDDELEICYTNKAINKERVDFTQNINIEAIAQPISNLQIKGNTTQSDTPMPTNPIAVQTITGEQAVNIFGKNLFNNSEPYSSTNATYNVENDKLSVICTRDNQNCYVVYRIYNIEPNTNYTFSYNAEADNIAAYSIRAYKTDGTYTTISNTTPSTNLNYNFTTPSEISFLAIFLYASRNTSSGVVNNKTTYSNIQLEEGLTATAYESYKSQNFLLSLPVANLFDKSTATYKNNYYINTSGVETSSTTSGYLTSYVKVTPNTQYTISGSIRLSSTTAAIYFYDYSKTWINRVSWSGNDNVGSFTFTTPNNCYFIQFQYTKSVFDADTVQICEGTSTTYWPYGTTQLELCKIGNFQDYIYYNNGWYLHKEIVKHTFDGSDNDSYNYNSDLSSVLAVNLNPDKVQNSAYKIGTVASGSWVFCDKFIYEQSTNNKEHIYITAGVNLGNDEYYGNIRLYIGHNRLDGYSSSLTNAEKVSLVRGWLQNHPTIAYYITRYPVEDTLITDTTLIEQLEALRNATLYNGTNNIVMSNGLSPYLKFDYIKDYETLNEDYLKDINVAFGEKFGPINRISIIDTDNDLDYYAEDSTSIKQNELTQVNIIDNELAFNGEEQTIASNILTKLNGLYYSINDFETTGVCYYDYLDVFNVEAKGDTYQCLLLNNEISITQGIKESIFTEEYENTETSSHNYETSIMSDKQVQFKINQQEGKIESKVEKDGVISAINQSAEEIKIQANKLSFEGATIDMTADNIKIQGENLDIDSDGVITLIDNSAASSLSEETLHSAYIIKSTDTVERAGTIETLSFKNEIVANGRKITLEDNWEYQETTGGGSAGIVEGVYSQPRLRFYAQSNDYSPSSSSGSYQDLDISLNAGISYNNINNGVLNSPLIITPDGRITCVSVTQTSKEENKKNFERLTNAKEILNSTDIYKYNMIDEEDETKKHIGFIIGEAYNYSQDITSVENNGVDIYSMVSVLWQVVKEQQKEIQELKEMIENGKY